MRDIAIIYHYFAHYRQPVMQSLCKAEDECEYRFDFFSDDVSNIPSIKLIDNDIMMRPVEEGGIRWKKLNNLWLKDLVLWQRGVLMLSWSSSYSTIIFLGDRRFLSTWIGALIARWRGKTVFFWTHGYKTLRGGIQGAIIRCFHRIPHAFLFYGHRAVELAVRDGFDKRRLFVIYNSLDFDKQQQCAADVSDDDVDRIRKRFSKPDLPMLLFSGRLTASKMVDWILRAQASLIRGGNPINLLIIGGGPERDSLISMCDELDLQSHAVFYGECYEERELAPLFLASDVFVIPGELGLSGIHAMGYGLPVITSNDFNCHGPEFEAIVPDVTGDFYRAESLESLIECIKKWTAKVTSEREEIRKACIERIGRTYTAQNQVKCIIQALREMNT